MSTNIPVGISLYCTLTKIVKSVSFCPGPCYAPFLLKHEQFPSATTSSCLKVKLQKAKKWMGKYNRHVSLGQPSEVRSIYFRVMLFKSTIDSHPYLPL